jgi:hypothetical protein
MRALRFLACPSFPAKDWNELGQAEAGQIMQGFSSNSKLVPLPMTDVGSLQAFEVFDRFKALAPELVIPELQAGEQMEPRELVWPVLQQGVGPVYHAIFDVDFSKGETQLVNQFKKWLRLPENRTWLDKYKAPKIGITGKPLDRLKDLAAWRLYRELGNDWNAANDFANQHRKDFKGREIFKRFKTKEQRAKHHQSSPKPFHNAKRQGGKPANDADLFGEAADARKAQASAWKHLAEIMPREFCAPGPLMLATFAEIEKLAVNG